jgi:molybdopterin molybdotransferase
MGGKEELLPFTEARAIALASVKAVGSETVEPEKALGRILRAPLTADRPLPPFNRAAMDGYAIRSADIQHGTARLKCVGILEAGKQWKGVIHSGETVKIMTGAPLPDGADAVVKVESSSVEGEMVTLKDPSAAKGSNVHEQGKDASRGETLAAEGAVLNPRCLAVAASIGATRVKVSRLIKVGVIVSGNELIQSAKKPAPVQIRDCNSHTLTHSLAMSGLASPKFYGIVADDPGKLAATIKKAIGQNDMVVISGGVSMGDTDYTYRVLKQLNVKKLFHRIAIRPGKPVWFGLAGKKPVFGLPGNPVSVTVTFHQIVLPVLRTMARAASVLPANYLLPLGMDVSKKHGLREFLLASLSDSGRTVVPQLGYQGSGDFVSAAKSAGVMVIPEEARSLTKGTVVEFNPWAG